MLVMKIWLGLLITLGCIINTAQADSGLGQVLQIGTHFRTLYGTPTWLLIVRDVDTGLVTPYQFDIHKEDNYWIAFTYGHSYRITASSLTFGNFAKINNFCNLENGILVGQSMVISLTGVLAPVKKGYLCNVYKYKDIPFTMTSQN